VGEFTAVGYFFGREIHQKENVPVGLIDNSWGGMPAESFMTREALASSADFKPILDRKDDAIARGTVEAQAKHAAAMMEWDAKYGKAATQATTTTKTKPAAPATQPPPRPAPPPNPHAPNHGSNIYNAMVHPLVGYAIKGAIWYQGESNASRAEQYRTLFPAMIADWRKQWGQGDFPFLFVQLANFGGWKPRPEQPADSAWAELREAQTMTLAASPNTAMAVIIDIGDTKDIHPRNKQDVGKRLALAAEKMVYGKTDVESSGPMYASHVVEGDKIRVKFAHADGLVARGGTPRSFAIAGADKKFHWADAAIEGDEIVVSSKDVPRPVAVRYAWEDDPQVNLYNGAGLPMCPFRTDDWPLGTAGAK
jgi:sialate O-acetylesterase